MLVRLLPFSFSILRQSFSFMKETCQETASYMDCGPCCGFYRWNHRVAEKKNQKENRMTCLASFIGLLLDA